jgi:hypothetical protein
MARRFPVKDSDFKRSGWCGNRPKCVEVAIVEEGVAVRDSNDPEGGTLFFDRDEWNAFVAGVKGGEFNA